MADITASMVKDLREKSGAGMMDCKKALNETAGDMDAAMDWLRTKGLAAAQKKSSRTAAEGLVGVAVSGTTGAAVEVNSETDFVAKNAQFQDFVREVTQVALAGAGDVDAIKAAAMPSGTTVAETLTNNIATIGENQSIRRVKRLAVEKGAVVPYVHNAAAPGLGKIGVLVALESTGAAEPLQVIGRQVAMHVAAASPLALDGAALDPAVVAREKQLLMDKNAGKPAHVMDKIVESGLKSYYREVSLLDQAFVHDGAKSVAQAIKDAEKQVGAPIVVTGFVRFALGEGIDRPDTPDFASEVASLR